MYSRREFGWILTSIPVVSAAAGFAADQRPNSTVKGVRILVQTYSYRSMFGFVWDAPRTEAARRHAVDVMVDATKQNGIEAVEFWIAPLEPVNVAYDYGRGGRLPSDPQRLKDRDTLREWRRSRQFDLYKYARTRFADAGIGIYSAMFNLSETCTDDEILAAFDICDTLGTKILTVNPSYKGVKRAAAMLGKRGMMLGVHNHNFVNDPDDFATAAGMLEALSWSPNVGITLDVGHYVAAGGDPVSFIANNHARILALHLKDRVKNDPAPHNDTNVVPWGKGDTPLKEILLLLAKRGYKIPAIIEYEHPGKESAVIEVGKCLDYAKSALASA